MLQLPFILLLVLCSYYSRAVFISLKKPRDIDGWIRYIQVRRWLDTVSSRHSLSLLLLAGGMTRTTQPSSGIIRTCVHVPLWLLFEGGAYFVQELQIVWLLFEGGIYSRKYGIHKSLLIHHRFYTLYFESKVERSIYLNICFGSRLVALCLYCNKTIL